MIHVNVEQTFRTFKYGKVLVKCSCLKLPRSWSLEEGGEDSSLPNCQTNSVIAFFTLSLLFFKFINTTAYHLGRSPLSCRAPHPGSIPSDRKSIPDKIRGSNRAKIRRLKQTMMMLIRTSTARRVNPLTMGLPSAAARVALQLAC